METGYSTSAIFSQAVAMGHERESRYFACGP
jgi:hypothetical protein